MKVFIQSVNGDSRMQDNLPRMTHFHTLKRRHIDKKREEERIKEDRLLLLLVRVSSFKCVKVCYSYQEKTFFVCVENVPIRCTCLIVYRLSMSTLSKFFFVLKVSPAVIRTW